MTISLSPDTQRLLEERLKAGPYGSPDEAVREALLLLEQQEREHEAAFQELKVKRERGATQAEQGELTDGEVFFDRLLGRDGRESRAAARSPE